MEALNREFAAGPASVPVLVLTAPALVVRRRLTPTRRRGCAGGCASSTKSGDEGAGAILSHLYGHFGLVRLSRLGHSVPWTKASGLVREPDAGDLHVRFDERGVETRATGELVRHRQTKGAATDMFGLKPPAPHSDSTENGR